MKAKQLVEKNIFHIYVWQKSIILNKQKFLTNQLEYILQQWVCKKRAQKALESFGCVWGDKDCPIALKLLESIVLLQVTGNMTIMFFSDKS